MHPEKACRLIRGHSSSTPTYFSVFMPYVFQPIKVKGRKFAYLPLNRSYKPIGQRDYVDYDNYEDSHAVYFAKDPATYLDVWHVIRDDGLWLYDDSTASKVDYFTRLEKLMARQMQLVS